ncbi:OmpA family protein [Glacieibacterium megasporae]|uniref:OmpA family protein n=1 Tax=Glacieibacterium megasporae TaxID=2835787 RepID=UPI001C1E4655|nr:OmpA family protein [Polymorphobacter megasporae]UAJ12969.1 OmpA family protein [Polymorphobacter megasporae]
MKQFVVPMIVSAGLALSACHKKPAPEATTTTTESTVVASAPSTSTTAPVAPAVPTPAPTPAAASAAAPVGSFNTSKEPVSTVKLGAFPYLSLPAGYIAANPQTLDLARFPFWVGDHFVWVEGKVYQSKIDPGEGKAFSKYELQKNIESLVVQAGGRKVAEAQLPSEMRGKLDPDAQQVDAGLGDIISNPAVTFLIHRADKDIWVHFNASTSSGSWAVAETKAFVPTAKLLPASALKDAIDKVGEATIAVNFAVDKATILPTSQPQIGEVVKLLADPALKLSVEGHTDNSGSPMHNLALSQARAKSVVAALVSAGVERTRLTAQGFGASRPIAGNTTEEGRAANRRVELVRA